ncbi:MAG: 5-oxoprolinase subunit PxpB, partial [Oscillospiraceae bacterium]|nr:5-oxoprolinase subunit PxpB [Oscillospiraceae bacterium]
MQQTPEFHPAGDCALTVQFGRVISPEVNQQVRALADTLARRPVRGVAECVPAFCSVLVVYDPCKIGYARLVKALRKRLAALGEGTRRARNVFKIPVLYDGEDLPFVARHAGLSVEEVIQLHSAPEYLIYMLGFLPGFAYLGGLDPKIHTPRLQNPRTKISAGAVGIGGEQTGIYPLASPGGWQLIGATPVRPYDPEREQPILYAAGDCIQFVPVGADDYQALEEKQARGERIWEVR